MGSDDKVFSHDGPFIKFIDFWASLIDKPVVWIRENIVLPNRKEYNWYHEKLRRVPTVDECYTDDDVCKYEAEQQFQRDWRVEKYMLDILRKRYEHCMFENPYDKDECKPLKETFDRAAVNFFIKYGELGFNANAVKCLMKQKNRMAWERRHGPVGSGKRPSIEESWQEEKNNN